MPDGFSRLVVVGVCGVVPGVWPGLKVWVPGRAAWFVHTFCLSGPGGSVQCTGHDLLL